jgi:hypothetical protein
MTATPMTLSSLSTVLGFDVIEYWTPDENNELRCLHYYLSDSIRQVIKRIFSDETAFSPAFAESWRNNSLQVRAPSPSPPPPPSCSFLSQFL